jgi:hypothetical protein
MTRAGIPARMPAGTPLGNPKSLAENLSSEVIADLSKALPPVKLFRKANRLSHCANPKSLGIDSSQRPGTFPTDWTLTSVSMSLPDR